MEAKSRLWHFVEYGEFPVEEIDVEEVEKDALAMLQKVRVQVYETGKGRFLKLLDEYGNYVGKIVGCSIDKVTIGSAYQTPFGVKVTLDCGERIVGWLYLEG